MYLMDYHHHTNHSFDSKAIMREVCKEAINKGLNEICFTEHFSLNPVVPTYGHMDFEKYFQDIKECRDQFESQLIVKAGIEICEPHQLINEYTQAFKSLDLDFILGSVHNINNDKLRIFLGNKSNLIAYREYFTEVYNMVSQADIDVIAHLDLLKRYAIQTVGNFKFHEVKDLIESILTKAIERNIGIEINTSGLRGKLNESLPSIHVIKLYKELGGEILTIGSDSHTVETVGSHLFEAIEMAKECGFKYMFKYEKRNPIAVKL
ncbi:histidinol-phosphatase HisJ family protein [Metabacillus sediminilitoris]|uniref:Histidinol-phosphatase n=2 Tax=Metabacillus sediminilitoris TaxID=2567941 RepID=A0A4S4BPI3_9BACI|nr:histidinol-phosphatase HisJ family protein [Metabacillus sediminilitoris]QGQ47674.1 histidinol-phosphatase HisJ family protein [Metabacillus sediminilitoris]THF76782.1 histidinol-phosphatase HisJ family protein [Metabacillus sediminilitoris]